MPLSRRDFLATSSTALLATSLRAGETDVPAGLVRNSLLKLSLAAYSFNRHLPNRGKPATASPEMTLADVVDYATAQRLPAVELTGYYFPTPITDESINNLKLRCFRSGLDISGTAIGNDFCLPDGPARDAQLKLTRDWIDIAQKLGAPVIRIFAGRVPKGETEADSITRCVAGIKESLEYAAQKGVCLALENHGGVTASPEQMLSIIEQVGESPWFGVNFDSGNFKTDDPYRDLAQIAPHAINAQIKVLMKPAGREPEPTDFARVIEILRDAQYRGYVVLEYEEEHPHERIPRFLDRLREVIAG